MKRLLGFLIVLISTSVFAQQSSQRLVVLASEVTREHVSFELTGNLDSDTVFVLYWPVTKQDRYAPSETRPTATSTQAQHGMFYAVGDVSISMITDSVTAADESDSLSVKVVPLSFNTRGTPAAGFYVTPSNKVTWLNFTSASTMTSTTEQILDWADGANYFCSLSGQTWPTEGFALIFKQYAGNVASVRTLINLDIKLSR